MIMESVPWNAFHSEGGILAVLSLFMSNDALKPDKLGLERILLVIEASLCS